MIVSIAMIAIVPIIVLLLVLMILYWWKKKDAIPTKDIDYQALFILGISFLPLGIIFTNTINPGFISFIGLGIFYIVIALVNKDNWKKKD